MIQEANKRYMSDSILLNKKINDIKSKQLLGVELNAEMYTLAATNMILRGDGSSVIIKDDAFRISNDTFENFKANRLLLNPPFSFREKGMPFVELGLTQLEKRGKAAVIIQDSAGSGKAVDTNRRILKKNTLVASIKMPRDLFAPMAGVQTSIYIFKAGIPHDYNKKVKFIDFRNDGFKRTNRSIKEVDDPHKKYTHLLNVFFEKRIQGTNSELDINCIEDFITESGDDWNLEHHYKRNVKAENIDFDKILFEHQMWQIKKQFEKDSMYKQEKRLERGQIFENKFILGGGEFKEFKIGDLFCKVDVKKLKISVSQLRENGDGNHELPALTASSENHGLVYKVPRENATVLKNVISVSANGSNTGIMFYQPDDFTVLQDSYAIEFDTSKQVNESQYLYLLTALQKSVRFKYDWSNKATWNKIKQDTIILPVKNKTIDFEFMEQYINLMK